MGRSDARSILIDADVVSHFISGGEADVIDQIFPGLSIYILDKVHRELQNWPSATVRSQISVLLSSRKIKLMNFPEDNELIKKEYLWIKSVMFKGDGESACLAVARYNHNILASSNLRDIKPYCIMHSINYLTTMDFLCHALDTGFFTIARCDDFINAVLAAKSKLPVKKMAEYSCRALDFINPTSNNRN